MVSAIFFSRRVESPQVTPAVVFRYKKKPDWIAGPWCWMLLHVVNY